MKIIKALFRKLSIFRSGLAMVNNQPAGKATLAVVIMLDVFILLSIIDGLDEHTNQLTSPQEFIPNYCSEIINGEWVLSHPDELSLFMDGGAYRLTTDSSLALHPTCKPVLAMLMGISNDAGAMSLLREYSMLSKKVSQARDGMSDINPAHNSLMLDKISGVNKLNPGASVQLEVSKRARRYDNLLERRSEVKTKIDNYSLLVELNNLRFPASVISDLRSANTSFKFWRPVKKLAMEFAFLLPMIIILLWWNSFSLKSERPFQVLVSSHLILVVLIPTGIKLLNLLYEALPKTFFSSIISALQSLNLIAIWYYLVMILLVMISLFSIKIIQKRIHLRNQAIRSNIVHSRICKGCCQECGNPSKSANKFCLICGFKMVSSCLSCQEDVPVGALHCGLCGVKQHL